MTEEFLKNYEKQMDLLLHGEPYLGIVRKKNNFRNPFANGHLANSFGA